MKQNKQKYIYFFLSSHQSFKNTVKGNIVKFYYNLKWKKINKFS